MGVIHNLMTAVGFQPIYAPQHVTHKAPAPRVTSRLYAQDDRWVIPATYLPKNQAELMQRLSWVNVAVSRIAETAAGVPIGVKKLEGEKTVDVENHPFELFLQNPNPDMSRYEFIESTIASRALTGNCYWWLNKSSENAPPSEVWIIPADRIIPVPDGNLSIRGYLYDTGYGEPDIPLEPWEVVHFKKYHPTNRYVGLSPIEALVNQAAGDIKATEWNANFFGKDNAKIPGILAFADNISDADWLKMREEFSRDYGGAKRNLLMLRNTGEKSVNWLPVGLSQSDMEFLGGREFTKEEIYSVFAPGLASMLAVNATQASATAGRMTFLEQAVWPHLQAVQEKITQRMMPLYGDNLRCEFEDVRMTDRAMVIEEQKVYALTHTVNEIRARHYDEEPLQDERGELFVAEIGIAGGGPTGEMAEEMGDDDRATPPATQQEPNAVDDEQMPDAGKAAAPVKVQPQVDNLTIELDKWQRKATKRIEEGNPEKAVQFASDVIPPTLHAAISGALEAAQDAQDVRAAFVWGAYP